MSEDIKNLNKVHDRLFTNLRDQWLDEWRDIYAEILPYRPRWYLSDHGKALAKETRVINSTPTRAMRTMVAGFISSITSPSRVWFRLTAGDELNEKGGVKKYLAECERRIRKHLIRSRFYQHLAQAIYPDLACIATALMIEEPDPRGGLQFVEKPPGEYALAVDHRGDVDTMFSEFKMSCRQMAGEFGTENLSTAARRSYERGDHDVEYAVRHAVYPRNDWTPSRADTNGKPWRSVMWEPDTDSGKLLKDAGYEENPLIAPRWNARSREAYGRGSPGWECKSDCRGVQAAERTKIKLLDKAADPALSVDESLVTGRVSLVPGAINYTRRNGSQSPIDAMQTITHGQIEAARESVQDAKKRVEQAFFVDLWLAMMQDERAQRATATEIQERRNEIMIQLGPMLENLNNGLLDPTVTRSFAILDRQGFLPDPPEELMDVDVALEVEFISILHQAQKMTGHAGIRELLNNVALLSQVGFVDSIDKVNSDKVIDEITDMLGVRPELVYSEEEVTAIREEKLAAQQQQQQQEQMLAGSEAVRNVSNAEPQKLQELAGMISPVANVGGPEQ